MHRDDLFKGDGQQIVQAAYRIIDAIQYEAPGRQVQAVAAVFLALVDLIQCRPWELLDAVKCILNDEESYTTTQALYAYINAEVLRDR